MEEQLKGVRHDYIRYANCWEDADVLLKGLRVQQGDRVLSIGSAGDNSFSLLVDDPELVVAVDINPVQLNLIELKKAAILALSHEEYEAFIGFREKADRKALFERVKQNLSDELQQFWAGRYDEIAAGIIYQGKFERYFLTFSKKVLPLIHTQKRIARLFASKNAFEQKQFFDRHWNNLRWRMLFKLFFSRFVMGRLGRDPKFLKEVQLSVSNFILDRSQQHLSSIRCQNNYFLYFILNGRFGQHRPHYVRKENYGIIKERVHRLKVCCGLAEDAFQQYEGFNRFNLSNIFEYMDRSLFAGVAQNLVENGEASSRYAYWNLMVPRKLAEVSEALYHDIEYSEKLSEEDMGFFYASVNFDEKTPTP